MPLNGMTLMKNATGGTTTGGTSATFSSDGVDVKNGLSVADMAETDFTIRSNVTLRTTRPVKLPDGTYTREKRYATVNVPSALPDGSIVNDFVRIELQVHPKRTTAQRTNVIMLGAQILTDADTQSFLLTGNLA